MVVFNQSIWIMGAGRAGVLAVERLGKREVDESLLVVDRRLAALQALGSTGVVRCCADAAGFLAAQLSRGRSAAWIIPAVPVHLAFEWLRLHLTPEHELTTVPIPGSVVGELPNPIHGLDQAVYASNADFICPDTCSEPDCICTVTGRPRPRVLSDHLSRLSPAGWTSIVIPSIQLAPGVGGLTPADLWAALDRMVAAEGRYLISTACKCHGVVHGLEIRKRGCSGATYLSQGA